MRRKNKGIYIVLVVIALIGISIGYAVLNSTLNINGKSTISKNTWDVHFENVQITDGSVEAVKIPAIENSTTVDFEVALNLPGDFFEFTVDAVNGGTIDAMIESISKEPELSIEQQKYLKYIIEYQNGEQIQAKQLVSTDSFVRLKVRVEFRKDITDTELPQTTEILTLGFTFNYVQADTTGTNVKANGIKKSLDIISGDLETVGSEVAIGDEHFYIISNTDGEIAMLSKYNLYIGNECTSSSSSSCSPYGEEATGIQDSTMIGYGEIPRKGTTKFSSADYWSSTVSTYPAYVYDSRSTLYNYVENYKKYLENQGIEIEDARLIKMEEIEFLGCSKSSYICTEAPSWVYETSYWSGEARTSSTVWRVNSGGFIYDDYYSDHHYSGVRPVIVLKPQV